MMALAGEASACGEVLLVLHKYHSAGLRVREAGHGCDLEVAVADQASGSEFRQRLQSLVHEGVIAADSEEWVVDRKIGIGHHFGAIRCDLAGTSAHPIKVSLRLGA